MEMSQAFWLGMVTLDSQTSTVWSRQLSDGKSLSFLVHSFMNASLDSQRIHEADYDMAFPFICKSKQKFVNKKLSSITPLEFEEIVDLDNRTTSYEIVKHHRGNPKVGSGYQ